MFSTTFIFDMRFYSTQCVYIFLFRNGSNHFRIFLDCSPKSRLTHLILFEGRNSQVYSFAPWQFFVHPTRHSTRRSTRYVAASTSSQSHAPIRNVTTECEPHPDVFQTNEQQRYGILIYSLDNRDPDDGLDIIPVQLGSIVSNGLDAPYLTAMQDALVDDSSLNLYHDMYTPFLGKHPIFAVNHCLKAK